jgi:hypothetical protein
MANPRTVGQGDQEGQGDAQSGECTSLGNQITALENEILQGKGGVQAMLNLRARMFEYASAGCGLRALPDPGELR